VRDELEGHLDDRSDAPVRHAEPVRTNVIKQIGKFVKRQTGVLLCAATAALLLTGCASMPRPPADEPDFAWPEEAAAPADGGIHTTGRDIPLSDNATARHIGDTVTIHLVESTAAQKSSSTSTAKTSKATMAAPIVFGNPVTVHGNNILSGSLGNDSSFAG